MTMSRYFFYLIFHLIIRHTFDSGKPYSLFFPKIRAWVAKQFIVSCGKKVEIGSRCSLSTDLRIGSRSGIGNNCLLQAGCTLGDDVMMGPDVKIYTKTHNYSAMDRPMHEQGIKSNAVVIGNDVWIGANVIILPGVTVGDHSILGASAVVTKPVPPYSIVGGNPARILKDRRESLD